MSPDEWPDPWKQEAAAERAKGKRQLLGLLGIGIIGIAIFAVVVGGLVHLRLAHFGARHARQVTHRHHPLNAPRLPTTSESNANGAENQFSCTDPNCDRNEDQPANK
jgi:hypothetical protein